MKVVVSVVNFVRSDGLNHRQIQSLLSEIDSECGKVLCYTEVRSLSHGTALKHILPLKL